MDSTTSNASCSQQEGSERRATFRSNGELIATAIRDFEQITVHLETVASASTSERISLLCQEVLRRELELLETLRAALKNVDDSILETHVQFSTDGTTPDLCWRDLRSGAEFFETVQSIHQDWTNAFSTASRQSAAAKNREVMSNIALAVEYANRDISRRYHDAVDL